MEKKATLSKSSRSFRAYELLSRRGQIPSTKRCFRCISDGHTHTEPRFPKGEFDRAWSKFYAKYPNSSGIISFSNPGFNRGYTQAVVSTGRGCGGLCGAGYFVLLAKEHGVWTVKTKAETWVS
jgi:hypothetical protein